MRFFSHSVRRRALVLLIPITLLFIGAPFSIHAQTASTVSTAASCLGNVLECGLSTIGYAIFSTVGLFLAVVAGLFNFAISKTVFEFATIFGNSAGLIAGWTVIRDVSNILLLFGFVFIGIATILDIHGYEMKKTLPRLVIFAVLLNFSLLATEAVIDGANVFSSILYQQSSDQSGSGCSVSNGQLNNCDQAVGIAGEIISSSKTSTLLNPGQFDNIGITAYLGLTLLETVVMVVLLAGAILLIIRAVVLVFLMVLSPIGFAGYAVPFLEPYAKRWWNTLLSQSFFAPVFLLLVFVGLKIGDTLGQGTNGGTSLTQIFESGQGMGVFLIFAVVVGFMVAALMAAKQLGAYGADFAVNMGTKAVSYPFAVLGRNTVGRGASAATKSFDRWVGNEHKGRVGGAIATGLKFTGIDREIHAAGKKVSGTKIGGFESFDEEQKAKKEYAREAAHGAEVGELKTALASNNTEAIEKFTQKMNLHGLEETIKECNDQQLAALGKVLSPDKFEKVMDSKEVNDAAKEKMAHARYEDVTPENAKDRTTKDLEILAKTDGAKFSRILEAEDASGKNYLKEEQLDVLAKSDRLTESQRQFVKDNTAAGRVEKWAGTDERHADAVKVFNSMTAENKMKVKASVMIEKNLVDNFRSQDIQAAITKNKFNNEQLDKLRESLEKRTGKEREEIEVYFEKNPFSAGVIGWKTRPAASSSASSSRTPPAASDAGARIRERIDAQSRGNNRPII